MGLQSDMVNEEDGVTLEGDVESPVVKAQFFKRLENALDYCDFISADEMVIRKVINGVELLGWQVHFTGSEGSR